MNQNWIVENLNNAFSTWNGKLTELWGLVTTGPQSFKGGAVWGVMQNLHNAMVGIGYALVVLFFAISLFKNTMNFHELKRPEAAVHYLIRFVAAKALVGYGMDIMLNIFSICNGVITDMTSGMGGISQAMVSLPGEMQTAIENVGFLASIPLWLVTILGSLFITVLSFVMILTVYFCFVQIVFSDGDIRFTDAAFWGVFPCGQPHVGLGAVGTPIYDLGGGMMGDRIVEFILHRGEKLLCDGAFHIVVGAALGIDVRDFLVKSSLAGPDVPDTLQLFLEIILAEKVLRLAQPCVIHHIAFDDELF